MDRPTPSTANRRGAHRLAVKGQARVEVRSGLTGLGPDLLVCALDLSQTGLRALLNAPLEKGREVEVLLQAPGMPQALKRAARVVWCGPRRDGSWCVGLHFDKPLPYSDLQRLGSPPTRAADPAPPAAPEPAEPTPTRVHTAIRKEQRFACHPQPLVRLVARPGFVHLSALLADVSPQGMGLLLDRPLEPGTELALSIRGQNPGETHSHAARVIRCTPREDGIWLLGCRLSGRLKEDELARLRGKGGGPGPAKG